VSDPASPGADGPTRVALVLVSHSAAAADGTAEIARQMAPDVTVLPAGGTPDGIGTSVDLVLAALQEALAAGSDAGVVVLTDLGSAVLTSEVALEMLDDDEAERVRVPSGPFIEGAVAAAVEAQQGGDLDAVERAVIRAWGLFADADATTDIDADTVPETPDPFVGALTARVTVRNALGLHARPAALLARTIAASGARVTVDGVDGSSVLELMRLGATGGRELTLTATGPDAQAALDEVVRLIESGFGEAQP
jgi:PTS hybrid protein